MLGERQDENPFHSCRHHDDPLGAPWPHQHRFRRRLQRRRIAHIGRPLRLIFHSLHPAPLAENHRLHQNTSRVDFLRHREIQPARQRG